ncbi:hypothetical protein AVO42_07580 [Thiomicrospira sp. XS5]|uniref:hypothetical protein n=1 Tax=Thiomicrospira sp. XS5 TaxID=1775636 RepID=UPI0007471060|nr:hypothetical protein [Thiomicrospira sp. XS5]KUJ75202.1 hypothetical protein AVO42_07580 [Thiomicrospira sp. XS5]
MVFKRVKSFCLAVLLFSPGLAVLPTAQAAGFEEKKGETHFEGRNREFRWESDRVHYKCSSGKKVTVIYMNIQPQGHLAFIDYDGVMRLMQPYRASGNSVKYMALDDHNSFRWHRIGDRGFLSYLPYGKHGEQRLEKLCQVDD